VPELVADGVDGFLEAPGDIAGQAARVTALLSDETLYARVAKAARATAMKRFCTTHVIPLYEHYYQEVCDRT
jgi:glycosyltransferase involved in cell wall biosynthesis